MASTLYRAPRGFYLVPDDVTMPPGDLEITSLSGTRVQVDASAVAAFQVTEAIARLHAKHAVTTIAGRLEAQVTQASATLNQVARASGDAVPNSAIEDLSSQLQGLVDAFQSADLTTAAGRKAVEAKLGTLQRVKDKALAESTVAELHRSAGDLMQAIDDAPSALEEPPEEPT